MCCFESGRKENVIMKKYCVKCGHEFQAVGREVICPECKAQAAEESKKAAVLKAKRASWAGESVPVRISGRASTVIRRYGAAHNVPFAAALDALLKASPFFASIGVEWGEITPYKSHRRDKHATEDATEDAPQDEKTSKAAADKAVKTSKAKKAVKTAADKAVKAATKKAVKTSKAALK